MKAAEMRAVALLASGAGGLLRAPLSGRVQVLSPDVARAAYTYRIR